MKRLTCSGRGKKGVFKRSTHNNFLTGMEKRYSNVRHENRKVILEKYINKMITFYDSSY